MVHNCRAHKSGVSKVFVRRATCGKMTGHGPHSIHYESSHGLKDIKYNAFVRASQKLAAGAKCGLGRTLDMPGIKIYLML